MGTLSNPTDAPGVVSERTRHIIQAGCAALWPHSETHHHAYESPTRIKYDPNPRSLKVRAESSIILLASPFAFLVLRLGMPPVRQLRLLQMKKRVLIRNVAVIDILLMLLAVR